MRMVKLNISITEPKKITEEEQSLLNARKKLTASKVETAVKELEKKLEVKSQAARLKQILSKKSKNPTPRSDSESSSQEIQTNPDKNKEDEQSKHRIESNLR